MWGGQDKPLHYLLSTAIGSDEIPSYYILSDLHLRIGFGLLQFHLM